MIFDSPYRDATLREHEEYMGSLYYALHEREEDADVMSHAACKVVQRVVLDWLKQPGTVAYRLRVSSASLEAYINARNGEDCIAVFDLPFDELVLSAADNALEHEGILPSQLSDMLRKLADQIDARGEVA